MDNVFELFSSLLGFSDLNNNKKFTYSVYTQKVHLSVNFFRCVTGVWIGSQECCLPDAIPALAGGRLAR